MLVEYFYYSYAFVEFLTKTQTIKAFDLMYRQFNFEIPKGNQSLGPGEYCYIGDYYIL